ncbi:ABC transporter permease [Pseudomonas corrugata]|uniref:ABC transporter permease n=1 Tax=Pseudomonas corrugata TaxID=47879 RepID=UPI0006D8D67C|nr:ABC transporter permease [Pseudomonas corrugata]
MNSMKSHLGAREGTVVKRKHVQLTMSRSRWLAMDEFSWVWFGTLALFVVSAVIAPGTVTKGSLLAMLPFAGMLAIVATGQTVVIQQRGLDMSAIGMVGLAGVLMAILGNALGSQLVAALLTLVAAVLVGALNGFLTSRLSISPLVATLAVNALLIGFVRSLTGNAPVSTAVSLQEFSHSKFLGLPFSIIFAFLFVVVVWIITRKTALGRRFIAVGINPAAALAAGVRVNAYQLGAYVVSAVCFAVAGMLLAGFIGSASHTAGNDYLLPAIAAVVVGGTPFTGGKGSVVASAVAALFMAQLGQMVLAMGASTAIQLLVQAFAILIAISVRNIPAVINSLTRKAVSK